MAAPAIFRGRLNNTELHMGIQEDTIKPASAELLRHTEKREVCISAHETDAVLPNLVRDLVPESAADFLPPGSLPSRLCMWKLIIAGSVNPPY